MKIFHGSLIVVDKPEIRVSDRLLDFGHGFYATTSIEQASEWGRKQCIRDRAVKFYVSTYNFNLAQAKKELKFIEFNGATKEWLQFICDNRQGRCKAEYDIVIGPVADDSVYQTVRLFEVGAYDEHEAIKRLKVEKLFNQILFHTNKALTFLQFVNHTEESINGKS